MADTLVERITPEGYVRCGCGHKMHAVFPKGERSLFPPGMVFPTPLVQMELTAPGTMPDAFAGFIAGLDLSGLEE